MYCRNCGKEIDENAAVCVSCGVPVGKGSNFCPNCSAPTDSEAVVCIKCGVNLKKKPSNSIAPPGEKTKLIAALLSFFLGGLGIHDFYLGYTRNGLIKLIGCVVGGALSVVIVGIPVLVAIGVWDFIDFVRIVTGKMTDAEGNELV